MKPEQCCAPFDCKSKDALSWREHVHKSHSNQVLVLIKIVPHPRPREGLMGCMHHYPQSMQGMLTFCTSWPVHDTHSQPLACEKRFWVQNSQEHTACLQHMCSVKNMVPCLEAWKWDMDPSFCMICCHSLWCIASFSPCCKNKRWACAFFVVTHQTGSD